MKLNKVFKNKTQMIIYSIITIICLCLFIVISKIDFTKSDLTDAEKFSSLYNMVSKNNLYKFAHASDVLEIVEGRSGIILLGFPMNKWTNYTASILNEVAMEQGVKEILYYDFHQDRKVSNGTYSILVSKLSAYMTVDDEGNMDIQAPAVLIVKKGKVIAYFDDTSILKGNVKPEDYYTEYQKGLTKSSFKTAIINYLNEE